ncbi:hypothetical protein OAN61_00505 [bacterium]|nr:hypothetical protein [bacterium]
MFVAVLLENFEREFNDTEELDVSSDDLVDLRKNFLSFLDKLEEAGRLPRGDTPARICARLQALQQQAGLYVSRRRAGPIALAAPPNCFNKKTLNILTVRNVKEYVLQLPDQSPFAVCRQVNEDLWYNRLLHELGHIPAEVRCFFSKRGAGAAGK